VGAKRKIVIVGAGGRLGAALRRAYRDVFEVTAFDHARLDLGDLKGLREKLAPLEFDTLINCAAQTNVDRCEEQPDEAFLLNGQAPGVLAEICAAKPAKMVHVSTDYVFDGLKTEPYTEKDQAVPISAYGESKRAGEKEVLAVDERHLVLRVSWVFGPDRPSFVDHLLGMACEKEKVAAVADKFSTPTYTKDIAEMLPAVAGMADPGSGDTGCSGLLHFSNEGACSWREYLQWAIDCADEIGMPLKTRTAGALSMSDMKSWVARRPVYSVLSTEKYQRLTGEKPRHWREAVAEYIRNSYSKS
jgi:dTDP-4-dehydrorhamnose reductase